MAMITVADFMKTDDFAEKNGFAGWVVAHRIAPADGMVYGHICEPISTEGELIKISCSCLIQLHPKLRVLPHKAVTVPFRECTGRRQIRGDWLFQASQGPNPEYFQLLMPNMIDKRAWEFLVQTLEQMGVVHSIVP